MNEITLRTELLIQLYQLVQESSQNRIIQSEVHEIAEIFNKKKLEMRKHLKDKFNELKTILKIQEQIAETVLKKNFAFIEGEIERLKKVPSHLFEDADGWS